MTITSTHQARRDIFKVFDDAWTANTAAIVGVVPTVFWQNVEVETVPTHLNWVLAAVTHVTGGNAAIGPHLFSHEGFFSAQIYLRRSEQGMSAGDQLVQVVLDAFEGKHSANGVWFRNARINEVGQNRDWFQINVLVDFEYRTVK